MRLEICNGKVKNARTANGLARGHCAGGGAKCQLACWHNKADKSHKHTHRHRERDTNTDTDRDRDRTSGSALGFFLTRPQGSKAAVRREGEEKGETNDYDDDDKSSSSSSHDNNNNNRKNKNSNSNKRKTSNVSGKNAKINDTATK